MGNLAVVENRLSLILKHLALCSFLLAIAPSLWAITAANSSVQVTAEDADEFSRLMDRYKIGTPGIEPGQRRIVFHGRTQSHVLRFPQILLRLKKRSDFLEKFPEMRPLVRNLAQSVQGLLKHDQAKGSKEIEHALKILARAQGYNMRALPPFGVPEEVHKKIVALLEKSIGDVNLIDQRVMKSLMATPKPGDDWKKALGQFMEVTDFYDTWESRQAELAGSGRKLDPPSTWIKKMVNEGKYPADQLAEVNLKIRLAEYLEDVRPLQDRVRFAKPEDFTKHGEKAKNDSSALKNMERVFQGKSGAIVVKAKALEAVREVAAIGADAASGVAKGLKGGAITGVLTGFEYLYSPQTVDPTDLASGLAMAMQESTCETKECKEFEAKCQQLTGIKSPLAQLAKRRPFDKCVEDFFRLPLQKQSELRSDRDIDELFEQITPRIASLKCEDSNRQVRLVTKFQQNIDHQLISFDQKGSPEKMTRPGDGENDFFYLNHNPSLQVCRGTWCRNYMMDQIRNKRLYFWTNDESYPKDSIRWAQQAEKVIRKQASQIMSCCSSEPCFGYYLNEDQKRISGAQSQRSGIR